MLVAIEGVDGTGKTTLVEQLKKVFPFCLTTKEPQDKEFIDEHSKTPMGEMYAYMLDHADHNDWLQVMNKDNLIFCDRYIDSRIAYQSVKLELPMEFIESLHFNSVEPDVTFILHADISYIAKRLASRDGELFFTDRTDENDNTFMRRRELYLYELNRIQDRYIELTQHPIGGYVTIDITGKSVRDIAYEIELYLFTHFKPEVERLAKERGHPNPLSKGIRTTHYLWDI